MGPAPSQPVNGELSHEDGGQLSQGQQGKVAEYAPRQVHSIQLRVEFIKILWDQPFIFDGLKA